MLLPPFRPQTGPLYPTLAVQHALVLHKRYLRILCWLPVQLISHDEGVEDVPFSRCNTSGQADATHVLRLRPVYDVEAILRKPPDGLKCECFPR